MQSIFSLHFLMVKNTVGNKQLLLISWLWQPIWRGVGQSTAPTLAPCPRQPPECGHCGPEHPCALWVFGAQKALELVLVPSGCCCLPFAQNSGDHLCYTFFWLQICVCEKLESIFLLL